MAVWQPFSVDEKEYTVPDKRTGQSPLSPRERELLQEAKRSFDGDRCRLGEGGENCGVIVENRPYQYE